MKFPVRKLLTALAFGFGAIAAPAALVLIEGANAPQPEMRNPAYAHSLATVLPIDAAVYHGWIKER